jgi:hypothetical protein
MNGGLLSKSTGSQAMVNDERGPAEDLEIFVKAEDPAPILAFLCEKLGPLSVNLKISESHVIYTCGNVKIVINGEIQDNFIAVWLPATKIWPSDYAFGCEIANALGLVVRCDPGCTYPSVSPFSDIFVELDNGQEKLVEWG